MDHPAEREDSDMKRYGAFLIQAVCAFAILTAGVRGEEAPAGVDPKADAALREMSDYLKGLGSFTVSLALHMHVEAEGTNQDVETDYLISKAKPESWAFAHAGGVEGISMYCDGKTIVTHVPQIDAYVEVEKLDATEIPGQAQNELLGPLSLGFGVLVDVPYDFMMDEVTSGSVVGEEDVDGVACRRLRFSQEDWDWDIWIEKGETPYPRKLSPDWARALFGGMGEEEMKKIKLEVTLLLKDWKANPEIAAETFKFEPPAGARKADSLEDLLSGGEGPHPLQGKPAPDFSLDLLGGGKMTLGDHKGKNVVILDFWATWCGPCVRAMPIITKVAKEFKEKGVVLYAVNEGENAETIGKFLEKQGLECTVALDADGAVGDLYKVTGIPTTVIVGKDGVAHKVHVGFGGGLEAQLTKELEELLGADAQEAKE